MLLHVCWVMGVRLAHSPNNEIVDLVYTRCLSNEDELTWNHLNNATKHAIPEWDSKHSGGHPHMSEDHYDICDGAKGATAAHKKTSKDITLFADMNHKKKASKLPRVAGQPSPICMRMHGMLRQLTTCTRRLQI